MWWCWRMIGGVIMATLLHDATRSSTATGSDATTALTILWHGDRGDTVEVGGRLSARVCCWSRGGNARLADSTRFFSSAVRHHADRIATSDPQPVLRDRSVSLRGASDDGQPFHLPDSRRSALTGRVYGAWSMRWPVRLEWDQSRFPPQRVDASAPRTQTKRLIGNPPPPPKKKTPKKKTPPNYAGN